MQLIHQGRRERVKQRFLEEGLDAFSEHEILELLLFYAIPQKDTNEIAHRLMDSFSSFDEVLQADYHALCAIEGIGSHAAVLLTLLLPIFKKYKKSKFSKKIRLNTIEQLHAYCLALLQYEKNEKFYVLCLNANYELVGKNIIAEGTNKEVYAYPKLIAENALKYNASFVIIVHNHMSGNILPSDADEKATKHIDQLLYLMDITLLDHVIISGRKAYSMKNNKAFDYGEEEL